MKVEFIIVLHNKDEHAFEERGPFDDYPKPNVIKSCLEESNYLFAKVEKRYSLEGEQKPMEAPVLELQPICIIHYLDEFGNDSNHYCYSESERQGMIVGLENLGLSYQVTNI